MENTKGYSSDSNQDKIPIKKVLIALDLDPTAQKVAEVGFSLAQSMGAEVVLLHVIGDSTIFSNGSFPIMGYTGFIVSPLQLENSAENTKVEAQKYLDSIKKHLGNENVQTVIKDGNASDKIISSANELNVDLIVIGSHSRRWLEEVLMGSVTESVLHRSLIPLLIVPTQASKKR